MRLHDARIGAAVAGAMLAALPTIEFLWFDGAPAGGDLITLLLGVALLVASAAGLRML